MDTYAAPESLYPFPDTIIIQDKPSAIQYGRAIFKQSIIHRCLIIWVDALVHKFPPTKRASRLSASAIRYLDPSSMRWKESVTFNTLPYGAQFAVEAEFIAIHEAFRIASKITDKFDRLMIFSDCQQVLQDLKTGSRFRFLTKTEMLGSLLSFANCMYDLGVAVELRWVPSHSGVEGNERVDELAKRLRRAGQSILAQESPLPILNNITITASSLESLRQALVGNTTQITPGTEDNSNKVNTEASIAFEKLSSRASPPPCMVKTVYESAIGEGHEVVGDDLVVASFEEETICDRENGVSLGKGVENGENGDAKAFNYAGAGTTGECLASRKVSEDDENVMM